MGRAESYAVELNWAPSNVQDKYISAVISEVPFNGMCWSPDLLTDSRGRKAHIWPADAAAPVLTQ